LLSVSRWLDPCVLSKHHASERAQSVKVLRAGGPYLAGQEGRHLLNFFAIVLFAGAGAWIVGLMHPMLGLIVLLASAPSARRQCARVTRYRKGIRGEELVSTLLGGLSDEFYLVNDIMLPGQRGNIDHVLVGPCGVVVIETKHYRGVIRCDRDRWFVDDRPIRNISRQVTGAAIAVRESLRSQCVAGHASSPRWVDGVVVFTNPLCRLEINRPGPTIVRCSELLALIAEKSRRRVLNASQASQLAAVLAGLGGSAAWRGAHVAASSAPGLGRVSRS
jgi:Nuclease-related domain